MAQKFCLKFGLGIGISSGANLIAAIRVAMANDDGRAVATVFADSNVKYLSTNLSKEEPVRDCYHTPQVELLGLESIR